MEFVSTNQAAQRLSHYEVFYPVCSQFVTERSELLETQDVLRRFCLSCDGSRTWSQVISATWPEVRRVLKSAIFAIETDLVLMLPHASTETVTVRYRLPAQEGTAGASTGDAPGVDPQDEIRTLARLRSRLQNFDRIDAYSIFGLKPGCGVQAVRKQFYRLVKQHHPDVFGGSTSAEIQVTAELVFIHIKDAHVELVNLEQNHDGGGNRIVKPSERVVSRVRSKEAATKTAQKAREELQASAPSVSRTTRSRSVRRKTAPPPPPSSEVVALGDEAGSDQKVRTRSPSTRESVRSKIRPAKPARRAVRAPAGTIASVRARSSESRSTKRSSEAPGAKVTAEEQRRQMMSKLPATKHFQNGKKALQGKQYDRAREAFRYAVEAEESNAEFRAYFAYSRYLADPTEVGRVVRMLQDCLSLDGRHVEVHLFLARIAKAEGDLHSALDSYEQVLKRDRKNIEAQREIRLSRMRQGGGKDETEQGKAGPGADGSFFSKLFNRKKDT